VPKTTETVTLERDYDASPERVFDAWTHVDLLTQWFGCAPETLWTVHRWDARVGGQIHVSLDFDGKPPFEVHGEFLVVDAPHRLSYRWAEDELVEVTIEPRESGSRMRLRHTFPSGEQAGPIRTNGWTSALEVLRKI
jgi:uncharacterized protein YndB with AHSA1/START domain